MKAKTVIVSVLSIALSLLLSCSSQRTSNSGYGYIVGILTYEEGNQMPSQNLTTKSVVERQVLLFELTNEKDAVMQNSLYTSVSTSLITKVKSNSNGEFEIKVGEGIYSLLIEEEDGFYAALLDMQNNLHPVTVTNGEKTIVNILINYKAFY